MTWRGTAEGSYHEVVDAIKGFTPTGDDHAVAFGHVQIAKDAALGIIDNRKSLDAAFAIQIGGHTSTKDSFSVSVVATVTQNQAVHVPTDASMESKGIEADTGLGEPPGPG